jgi:putative hydrolase of the HAD superfamily
MSASPVLVLDLDGVVLLSGADAAQPWTAGLRGDWGIDPEEMNRDFFLGVFVDVLRGRLDLYVALQEYFEPKGLGDRVEDFVTYWFERDSVVDHDLLEQVAAWRRKTGARCFAASNQEHHRVAYLRDQLGLGAHFDEIVYSAALGVCKPERIFFTTAEARMGVRTARSILFIDDSPANVDAARSCGWRAVLYRGRESLAAVLERTG